MEYGLLGEKLGHSYSPEIHRIMGGYTYRLYPVSPEELGAILREKAFQGLNVTIPYKQAVLPFCDEVSDSVREVGSANTLVCEGGRIRAYNTDLAGMRTMLAHAGISLEGKKAVILGSGGTSLTARAVCRTGGARETVVVSRSGPVTYERLYREHTDAQVLINATPVGMFPHTLRTPADLSAFPHLEGVAEVIYNPARTALVMDAEERGIAYTDGLVMLVAQAWHAMRLFLGRDVPEERMKEAYVRVRTARCNLVLRGYGAEAAREAAGRLGREAVILGEDADLPAFEEAGKASGLVISVPGGHLDAPHLRALRQNGMVFTSGEEEQGAPDTGRILEAFHEAADREWAQPQHAGHP